MSVLPPWLQIVVAVAAITGPILTLWLRRRDTQPRLSVEMDGKPGGGLIQSVDYTVRNKGRVAVPVQRLYLQLGYPGQRPRTMSVPKMTGPRQLPLQLAPRDAATFSTQAGVLSRAAKAQWPGSAVYIIPTVVDGLGKQYQAKGIHLTFTDKPLDQMTQPVPLGLRLRLYGWRLWRKIRGKG